MKFTPKEDITGKAGKIFEADSPYTSEKQGLSDETVERWYRNGWVEIEGRDPAPPRQVRGVVLQPDSAKVPQKEKGNA